MTTLPIARRPEEVATRTFDWGTIKWLVTPHLDEGADLTTGEVIVYPGKGHAPHVHPHEQEVIYVVSGEGVQTVGEDGEPFPIREGDAVYIPANTLHSTYNTIWRPLRLVVVYTPGGAETGLDALPDAKILEPGVAPAVLGERDGVLVGVDPEPGSSRDGLPGPARPSLRQSRLGRGEGLGQHGPALCAGLRGPADQGDGDELVDHGGGQVHGLAQLRQAADPLGAAPEPAAT